MDRKRLQAFQAVAQKSRRVLALVILSMLILVFRLCFLVLHDPEKKIYESKKGRQRLEIISAPRGTIRDRFYTTLAANQIDYRLSIVWSEIAEIPRRVLRPSKRAKDSGAWRYVRREYIQALCQMIAKNVPTLHAQRIEDIIYSYAIFSHTAPVVIATNLSEKQFYELSGLAKDWPGLRVEMGAKRVYPQGKSLCHVLGYTAPIQREEYEAVLHERRHLVKAIQKREESCLQTCDTLHDEIDDPFDKEEYHTLKQRLAIVDRKLYTINDFIGRSGIESTYENALRGLHGKKLYETNARGDIVKEITGSKSAIPGKRVVLTTSIELQKYCEGLLLQSELDRRRWLISEKNRIKNGAIDPFIRGGAIVALDPKSGDVLAMASTPRFDPNDFIHDTTTPLIAKSMQQKVTSAYSSRKRISWIQSNEWLSQIWEGKFPLSREIWNNTKQNIEEEKQWLTWQMFLTSVLPYESNIKTLLHSSKKLETVFSIQEELMAAVDQTQLTPKQIVEAIFSKENMSMMTSHDQKRVHFEKLRSLCKECHTPNECLAYVDISRLFLRCSECLPHIKQKIQHLSIGTWFSVLQAILYSRHLLEDCLMISFEEGPFQKWRKEKEKEFMKSVREKEIQNKTLNKPFIMYIDQECRRQFHEWWNENMYSVLHCFYSHIVTLQNKDALYSQPKWIQNSVERVAQFVTQSWQYRWTQSEKKRQQLKDINSIKLASRLIVSCSFKEQHAFFSMAKSLAELSCEPLFATYGSIRRFGKPKKLSHLVASLYSIISPPAQSLAYMLATPPGSVFKLVTAYSLLREQETRNEKKDQKRSIPLVPNFYILKDHTFKIGSKTYVGTFSSGEAIPQIYKGGRIPKSLSQSIGSVDLIKAIEFSSNPFFALSASEYLSSPSTLIEDAKKMGFGEKSGLLLPGETSGSVPDDISTNKTALYTTAIGQHTLLSTPIQIASMLATYANDGDVVSPKIVSMVVGASPKEEKQLVLDKQEEDISINRCLESVGIDFPLWLKAVPEKKKQRIWVMQRQCRRHIPMSYEVKNMIFTGMKKVAEKIVGDTKNLHYLLGHRPELLSALKKQKSYMLAKTSTAESYEILGIPYGQKPFMYSHTGIGTLFFPKTYTVDSYKFMHISPDIVIIVVLKYGSFGKETGPIAAKIAEEWRKISLSH